MPATGGFDLNTVLAHEVGHVLGIADLAPAADRPADLMDQTVAPGEVRRPSAMDVRLAVVGAGEPSTGTAANALPPDVSPMPPAFGDALLTPSSRVGGDSSTSLAAPPLDHSTAQQPVTDERPPVRVDEPMLAEWPADGGVRDWWTAEPLDPEFGP
jgi:hypothetical protein